MDLRSIVNTDDRTQEKSRLPNAASAAPPSLPHMSQTVPPSTPSSNASSPQQPHLYHPISAPPLRTPSQHAGGPPYAYPQQATQQSPSSQQYRSLDGQYSMTSSRPTSQGYAYQTQYPPAPPTYQGQTSFTNAHTSSVSPTPPSQSGRTPGSMRQSPMSITSHAPTQHYHQQSQPNTPLGPPLSHPYRGAAPEVPSPFHGRTISGASSHGIVSGSPAQHHPSIANLTESPSAYGRPSPHASRRASEFVGGDERRQSVSVSPKTILPHIPSLGSRQSSQQESLSSRNSQQYNSAAFAAESPNHVTQMPPAHAVAPSQKFAQYPHSASEVSQATSLHPAMNSPAPLPPTALSQVGGTHGPPPPSRIQHSSQKMGMNHLVTPTSAVPPTANGGPTPYIDSASLPPTNGMSSQPSMTSQVSMESHISNPPKRKENPSIFMKTSRSATPKAQPPSTFTPPTAASSHVEPSSQHGAAVPEAPSTMKMESAPPVSTGHLETRASPMVGGAMADTKPTQKRPASSHYDEPPPKQLKQQKYTQRPRWAQLSQHNPRYAQQGQVNGSSGNQAQPRQAKVNGAASKLNGASERQNGRQRMEIDPNAPIDEDLVNARSTLGQDWERAFNGQAPLADLTRAVADWTFRRLMELKDVGTDPREGTVEIEAKIGSLLDNETRERCSLPVKSACVLDPETATRRYHFESRMVEAEHAHMNKMLNEEFKKSWDSKARPKMQYQHYVDIDSFRTLNQTGLNILPPSILRHVNLQRPPKLRITTRKEKDRPAEVVARIVKVPIANLHIFNPYDEYDLRISINVEVNLNRPDLNLDEIIADTDVSPSPDRRKDRVSYKTLAYQLDLTRVDVHGIGQPKYELEVEVDTVTLREQMARAEQGQPHAFGHVVSGLLDNSALLMKQKPQRS